MEEQLHRGQIVKQRVKLNGVSITHIAEELGTTRVTLNNWFATEDLDYKKILQIGRVIKHDFSEQFPEIKMYKAEFLLDESEGKDMQSAKLKELKSELERWKTEAYYMAKELSEIKDKYYNLLLNKEK